MVDDEGSVPRLAHGLKGGSAALGATALAEVCRERSRVRAAVTELLAAAGPGGRGDAGGPPTIER